MSLSSGRAGNRGPTAARVLSPHSSESDERQSGPGQWLSSSPGMDLEVTLHVLC